MSSPGEYARLLTNVAMLATFKDLRPVEQGPELVAIITVSAEATPFQAELRFSFFSPPPPVDDSQGSHRR